MNDVFGVFGVFGAIGDMDTDNKRVAGFAGIVDVEVEVEVEVDLVDIDGIVRSFVRGMIPISYL